MLAPLAIVVAALLPFAELQAQTQTHAGQYELADIEFGAQLYAGRCIVCHGERGDAMPGASLASGRFRNATSDRELSTVIRDGLPGTAMVAMGYTPGELTALVAYLRNMSTFDMRGTARGDAERGRALYASSGCASCHRVAGQGGRQGPDLTRIGSERTAAGLDRTLLDPRAAMLPINRPVRAVTRDGRVIVGRRVNEDTFTVQIIGPDGRLVAVDKQELREYSIGTEASMPSYADELDGQARADVVAYLLSLKGPNP